MYSFDFMSLPFVVQLIMVLGEKTSFFIVHDI